MAVTHFETHTYKNGEWVPRAACSGRILANLTTDPEAVTCNAGACAGERNAARRRASSAAIERHGRDGARFAVATPAGQLRAVLIVQNDGQPPLELHNIDVFALDDLATAAAMARSTLMFRDPEGYEAELERRRDIERERRLDEVRIEAERKATEEIERKRAEGVL